jgi:hypothetical protein
MININYKAPFLNNEDDEDEEEENATPNKKDKKDDGLMLNKQMEKLFY